MGKFKSSATGKGYLGEIMVHKVSGQAGVVENVIESQAGWAPQITLKLRDGSLKKGKLSDFKEATAEQKRSFSTADAGEPAGQSA